MGKAQTMFIGGIYRSNRFGSFKVIEYISNAEVLVRFIDTGYITEATAHNIRRGLVKDKLMPFVLGEGFCNVPTIDGNGKKLKEYRLWLSMLTRCYDDKYLNEYPTYKDCCVSDGFKNFSIFKGWCDSQLFIDGYVLDKDLLVKGNKIYSEDTCCFVPEAINLLIINNKTSRGDYPVGVTKTSENKFRARLNKGKGNVVHLGYHKTPEDAFNAYKNAKESYIKEVASKWKDKIDPRAYEALMNYQVEITD